MEENRIFDTFKQHLYNGKINLKDLLPDELDHFFHLLGEPKFRSQQLIRWMYVRLVDDFQQMTDLSKNLRTTLNRIAIIPQLDLQRYQASSYQDTTKYLFDLTDGQNIESVKMRYLENLGPGRVAVCVSSQVGCALRCKFCASGLAGLKRNLATWEIVDQIVQIQKRIKPQGERIANVVFMGIGEPLQNYANLLRAIKLINLAEGIAIGMRHLTISTAGLVPQILKLGEEQLPITLAISLHATSDDLRSQLMPINKRWPIRTLIEACKHYQRLTGRRITFEYILLHDVNDSIEEAKRLASLLKGIRALVNLIPWNPVEGLPFQRSSPKRIKAFQSAVEQAGIRCTLRREKGSDIAAACGQLRLKNTLASL